MIYNDTNITAANNTLQIITELNTLSNNLYAYMFLFALATILWGSFYFSSGRPMTSLAASGFITTLIATYLIIINMIAWPALAFTVSAMLIGILFSRLIE
jgi:hypothetical protein